MKIKTFWISLQGWYTNPELVNESGVCEIIETDSIDVDPTHFYKETNFGQGLYWAKDSCIGPFKNELEAQEFVTNYGTQESIKLQQKIDKIQKKIDNYSNPKFTTKIL